MPNAYADAHDMQDPHSTFFKTIKVYNYPLTAKLTNFMTFSRAIYLEFR